MERRFNSCKILNDEEIEESKNVLTSFRRFDVEELQRKFSPFEKTTHQKKEFPFLFQKKKMRVYEEKKISIDELMGKIESLKVDDNSNAIIEDTDEKFREYVSHTPEWPKTREEFEAVHQEIVEHYANLKKNEEHKIVKDELQ